MNVAIVVVVGLLVVQAVLMGLAYRQQKANAVTTQESVAGLSQTLCEVLENLEAHSSNTQTQHDVVRAHYQNVQVCHDSALSHHNDARTHYNNTQAYRESVQAYHESAQKHRESVQAYYDNIQAYYDNIQAHHTNVRAYHRNVLEVLEAEPVIEPDTGPACDHRWRIENKDTLPSTWSQLAEDERARVEPQEWLFRIAVATTYICTVCGELRTEMVTTVEEDEPES